MASVKMPLKYVCWWFSGGFTGPVHTDKSYIFLYKSGKPAQSGQNLYITVTPVVFKTPDKDGFVESLYKFCLFFFVKQESDIFSKDGWFNIAQLQ